MKDSYVWVVTMDSMDKEDFMICGVFADYVDATTYIKNEKKNNKVFEYTATQVKIQ